MPLNRTETLYAAREIQTQIIVDELMQPANLRVVPLKYVPIRFSFRIPPPLRNLPQAEYRSAKEITLRKVTDQLAISTLNINHSTEMINLPPSRCQVKITDPLPESIKRIAGRMEGLAGCAFRDGVNDAYLAILTSLQEMPPEVPELRFFMRNALEPITKVAETTYRGHIGYLPTIIPNVYIRYCYPPRTQTPQVSILVVPFGQSINTNHSLW